MATSGTFSVSVSRLGGYSGRLQVGTEIYRFSGRLDAQCHAGISLSHLKERPLTLSLAVGTDDRMGQISGTFSDGDWLANLSGERAVFNATNDPAPFAGSYTVVFPGTDSDPLRPTGDGFGTVRVFRSGLTVLASTGSASGIARSEPHGTRRAVTRRARFHAIRTRHPKCFPQDDRATSRALS